jgi:hypothetical protein
MSNGCNDAHLETAMPFAKLIAHGQTCAQVWERILPFQLRRSPWVAKVFLVLDLLAMGEQMTRDVSKYFLSWNYCTNFWQHPKLYSDSQTGSLGGMTNHWSTTCTGWKLQKGGRVPAKQGQPVCNPAGSIQPGWDGCLHLSQKYVCSVNDVFTSSDNAGYRSSEQDPMLSSAGDT